MKKCSVCKESKVLIDFTKKKSAKDGLNAACKACTRSRSKKHHASNKEYYAKKAKLRNEAYRKATLSKIRKIKEDTACVDCNQYYPHYVMDFDHLRDKEFSIANAARNHIKWSRVKAEIDKCEVVCSNCHRERTWSRRH
jgi:hypothetical protein